jgi:hypothetical protein
VALYGPAGVGKSALVAAAIWQLASGNIPPATFPDGIIYHNFYNQPRVDIALEQIARTLGEEPKPTPYDAVQRALTGRQVLLVLGGAEQADDLAGLLDIRGNCGVVLTSRHSYETIDTCQELGPLPLAEAVTLLQAWGGWPATDQVSAQQICELVGRLPLAIRLAGQHLAARREKGLLSSVRRVFKHKPEQKNPDIYAALEELVDHGLLRQVGQRYEVTHSSIHTYARQQLAPPAKSIRRLATCYMALAWEQIGLGREGYVRLDTDRPHFMRVLNGCVQLEDWEAAYGLAAAIEDYLDRQEHWAERVIANEIGLIAAWQLGRPNEGDWLGNLGDTYRTMGHAKWAIEHFEKALATARQGGDRHSEANSLGFGADRARPAVSQASSGHLRENPVTQRRLCPRMVG